MDFFNNSSQASLAAISGVAAAGIVYYMISSKVDSAGKAVIDDKIMSKAGAAGAVAAGCAYAGFNMMDNKMAVAGISAGLGWYAPSLLFEAK